MRSWLIVVTVTAAVWTAGCVDAPGFRCTTSAQCGAQGICEAIGECSFPDGDCMSGRRFGAHGSSMAGQCTGTDGGPLPDGGDGGPLPDGGDGGPVPDGGDGGVNLDCVDQIVSSGGPRTCVRQGSKVFCWGRNGGELGDGTQVSRSAPAQVVGLTSPIDLVAGTFHACVRQQDGRVMCWGANGYYQLANADLNTQASPVEVLGARNATVLSLGYSHSCALMSGGAALCWGGNEDGQIGNGSSATPVQQPTSVVDVPALSGLAAGGTQTCGLATGAAGEVWCWGGNAYGQLGLGDNIPHPRPLKSMMTGAVELAAGFTHTCARKGDGTVWCWGSNENGQLGFAMNDSYRSMPVQVKNLVDVVSITSGYAHTCAVKRDGSMWCWGNDSYGQLGDRTVIYSREQPVEVQGLPFALQAATGYSHSCARTHAGVRCWGDDHWGQLGAGTLIHSATPLQVSGLTGAVELTTGDGHSCARTSGGMTLCWGSNNNGELGDGTYARRSAPVQVLQSAGFKRIEAGENATCAINASDELRCWGSDAEGELGLGGAVGGDETVPTVVPGATTVTGMAVGVQHICHVRSDKTLRCAGSNDGGRLGDGTTTSSTTPVLALATGVDEVGAGYRLGCARVGGGVRCWGNNANGALGDGTTMPRTGAVTVMDQATAIPLAGALQLSTGNDHSCVRTATKLYCWGNGYDGQLGIGTDASRAYPTEVTLAGAVQSVAGSGDTTCVIKAGGSVLCFGRGDLGQIGDGAYVDKLVPTAVTGLTDVVELSGAATHVCARKSDGSVWCWGDNSAGELGVGTTLSSLVPLAVTLSCPTP